MRRISALLLLVSGAAVAQSFEVATVKAAAPPTTSMGPGGGMRIGIRMGAQGGPGTSDPGQITYSNMALKNLLVTAYGVKSYQVSGPAWLDTERFDIVAKVPPGATKEDVTVMLQNLLADRFKLTIHREKKDMPMYSLTVGKNGPKLKESPPDDPNAKDAANEPQAETQRKQLAQAATTFARGGDLPPMPPGGRGGTRMMMMPGRMKLSTNKQSMTQFAEFLGNQMDKPVVDQTGLTKNYDFSLEFSPESLGSGRGGMPGMPAGAGMMVAVNGGPGPGGPGGGGGGDAAAPPEAEAPAPTLFAALQDQLGLKLEQKKGSVDLIVVDHLEKVPTEN